MIEKMIKLDCTDFLLFLTGRVGFVVHEFEGDTSLSWHIASNKLDEQKKALAKVKKKA